MGGSSFGPCGELEGLMGGPRGTRGVLGGCFFLEEEHNGARNMVAAVDEVGVWCGDFWRAVEGSKGR